MIVAEACFHSLLYRKLKLSSENTTRRQMEAFATLAHIHWVYEIKRIDIKAGNCCSVGSAREINMSKSF